jgi:hypothetical protein
MAQGTHTEGMLESGKHRGVIFRVSAIKDALLCGPFIQVVKRPEDVTAHD